MMFKKKVYYVIILLVCCSMVRWTWVSLTFISESSNSLKQTRDIEVRYIVDKYENVLNMNKFYNQADDGSESIHDTWKMTVNQKMSTSGLQKTNTGGLQKTNTGGLQKDNCKLKFNYRNPKRHLMKLKGSVKINANCTLLFERNVKHARLIHASLRRWKNTVSDGLFMDRLTSNCSTLFNDFVNSFYVSKTEMEFPIAFEMLIYYKPDRIQQYIRLLKNIYRPQNVYCIHIDMKAPQWWSQSLKDFANCFPNVIIARNPVKVDYATSSILYAHFKCFHELLETPLDWKYVISLHGTELPLITNRQIVEVLRKMNGSNLIQKGEDSSKEDAQSHAWITFKAKSVNDGRGVILTNESLGPIPYNLSVYKSAASANSAFSKRFVSFMLNNKKAVAFAKFLKDVQSGVEFFFSTVNSLPEAPGGYHTYQGNESNIPVVAHRDWVFQRKTFRKYCMRHRVVHNICIVSSSDLPRLRDASINMSWWFHNKYFIEYDHIVMDCMENLLLQRNGNEYEKDCVTVGTGPHIQSS